MTDRAIDQIMPHSVERELFERRVKTAEDYLWFAEAVNGPSLSRYRLITSRLMVFKIHAILNPG